MLECRRLDSGVPCHHREATNAGLDRARAVTRWLAERGCGKLSQGDELIGLQRAFLYAGARGIITTLWKVEDPSTFDLMRVFYDASRTLGPADALSHAQRAVLVQSPHPFVWAGFGLAGMPE